MDNTPRPVTPWATPADERTMAPSDLGPILARHRRRRGWSLRQAARRIGITAGYLCNLEHGNRCPSRPVAVALADALDITGDDRHAVLEAGLDHVGRDWTPENARTYRYGQSDPERFATP